jgi:hypothetical protein
MQTYSKPDGMGKSGYGQSCVKLLQGLPTRDNHSRNELTSMTNTIIYKSFIHHGFASLQLFVMAPGASSGAASQKNSNASPSRIVHGTKRLASTIVNLHKIKPE